MWTTNFLLAMLCWNLITVPSFLIKRLSRNAKKFRYAVESVLADNNYGGGELTSSPRVSEYLSGDNVVRNSTNSMYTKSKKPWAGSKYSPVKRLMRRESYIKSDGLLPGNYINNAATLHFDDSKSEALNIMRNASRLAGIGAGNEAFQLLSSAAAISSLSKEFSSLLVEFNMVQSSLLHSA